MGIGGGVGVVIVGVLALGGGGLVGLLFTGELRPAASTSSRPQEPSIEEGVVDDVGLSWPLGGGAGCIPAPMLVELEPPTPMAVTKNKKSLTNIILYPI